jgi:ribonuclease P protein component
LRLTSDREIRETINSKTFYTRTPLFSLSASPNNGAFSRLAVVTSRKVGPAVVRNRLRRLFKSAFLRISDNIGKNIDIVLFPRSTALPYKAQKLAEDLEKSLMKALHVNQ